MVSHQQDLAAESCECGKCDGFEYRAKCHPNAGVRLAYIKSVNELRVICSECGNAIDAIAVAKATTH